MDNSACLFTANRSEFAFAVGDIGVEKSVSLLTAHRADIVFVAGVIGLTCFLFWNWMVVSRMFIASKGYGIHTLPIDLTALTQSL